jgi:prevent-host-death family protein
MKTVGAYQAKTRFAALLRKVAKGESFTITRHGAPVARLIPPETEHRGDVSDVIAELRELRKGVKLRGLSIRKMIEEGRH